MQRKLFTVAATWAVVGCVAASPSTAVVGGSDAAPGQFPSVAEITYGAPGVGIFLCSGTLIDPTHVLTAGHCSSITKPAFVSSPVSWPPQSINVWIGGTESGEGEKAPVSSVSIPPDYLGLTDRNDISILELAASSSMAPTQVAAASERAIWDPGTLATIAGWGRTEEGGDLPDTLQWAQVPITTDEYCESAYSDEDGWDFDPETMVCAGYPEGGVDTCQGDSGGPLFADASTGVRRVVGATSWGNGCAREGFPGVYARVADTKLRTWIESVTPEGVADGSTTSGGDTGGTKTKGSGKGNGKGPGPKKGKP